MDMNGMAPIAPMTGSPYNQQTPFQRPMSIGSGGGYAQPPARALPKHPEFRGPTSAVFNLGVAKSSLQHMGITQDEDGEAGLTTQDGTPTGTPPPMIQPDLPKSLHADKDAIWSLSKDEAVRLIHVWQDEMGIMYPVVDIDRLIRHATLLFTFMEAARRSGLMESSMPGADAIHDEQTNNLKLIVAIALTLEGSGKSDLGRRLWDCVKTPIETIGFSPPDVRGLQMLVLAVSQFLSNASERTSWLTPSRPCIISIAMTRVWRGVSQETQHEWPWSLDYTGTKHTTRSSPQTRNLISL